MRCPTCNNELRLVTSPIKVDPMFEDIDFVRHIHDRRSFVCKDFCPAHTELGYHTEVEVRDNWWFSPSYVIPVKVNNTWLLISGPSIDNCSTQLFSLSNKSYTIHMPIEMLKIPYYALPVNEDFNTELDKLISRFKKLMVLV